MIIVNEEIAVCQVQADLGKDIYGEKMIRPQGCGNHLPRWCFTDQRANTFCDYCKWRQGIDVDRIQEILPEILEVYPPENNYQRKARPAQIKNRIEKRETYIQAACRIIERGNKITLKALTEETGFSTTNVYDYFKTRPCQRLTEIAEGRLRRMPEVGHV